LRYIVNITVPCTVRQTGSLLSNKVIQY